MKRSPVTNPDRVMRVLKYSFVISGLLFAEVAYKVPSQSHQAPEPALEIAIVLVALSNIIAGFLAAKFLTLASRAQQSKTATPLSRWMTSNVLSLAFFEACLLFGLVLHMLGGRTRLVQLLFVAGLIAMIVWSPGEAPAADGTDVPRIETS